MQLLPSAGTWTEKEGNFEEDRFLLSNSTMYTAVTTVKVWLQKRMLVIFCIMSEFTIESVNDANIAFLVMSVCYPTYCAKSTALWGIGLENEMWTYVDDDFFELEFIHNFITLTTATGNKEKSTQIWS